jgi:hypothetical protein
MKSSMKYDVSYEWIAAYAECNNIKYGKLMINDWRFTISS